MKKFLLWSALSASLSPVSALHASETLSTLTASASIITVPEISGGTPMAFGSILRPASPGTITINPQDNSVSLAGLTLHSGSPAAAEVTISAGGSGFITVDDLINTSGTGGVSLESPRLSYDGGPVSSGDSMESTLSGVTFSPTGATLRIGATLRVEPIAEEGNHDFSYQVTVNND